MPLPATLVAGVWSLLIAATALAAGQSEPPPETITVQPQDTGEALVNPGMGWTMHFYSNIPSNYGSRLEPADTVDDFPGLSTVYLRVPWAFIEPAEGRFNWPLLDTPAQRWIAKGKRVALRITCSENWVRFATPEWVKQAGAKGVLYNFGQGPAENGACWDPDYLDPVFLEKLDRFLAALAARYDNPHTAFVDVGSFGMWGEGHTHMSSHVPEAQIARIIAQHIDLYRKHFKQTLLCISDDVVGHDRPGRHFPITDDALTKGVTLRDDSILVQPPPHSWYHAEMAQAFWPRLPVILEHEHYGGSKARRAWGDGSLLVKAVEDYHASYMSIHWWPRELLNENREVIKRINLRMGYRLQPRRITWPRTVAIGRPFAVVSEWANAGVAPCYPGGYMALTVKDAKGGIVSLLVEDGFTMRDLQVGPPGKAPVKTLRSEFTIGQIAPTTRPGTYDVYVSVGLRNGTPQIALPLPDHDGQSRYKVGSITLVESR